MKKTVHFKALVKYLSSENIGLVTPVSSDYRSEIKFPFALKSYIAAQTFTETEIVFPGDSANIDVTLIGADEFLEKLYRGMDFELSDNSGSIGNGVITEVY